MSDLIPYSTATELASLYHQTTEEVLKLMAEADQKLHALNEKFGRASPRTARSSRTLMSTQSQSSRERITTALT